MLRISGTDFDVDGYLARTEWGEFELDVYRKGEKKLHRSKGLHSDSGFAICVSDNEFDDFDKFQSDTMEFISRYKQNLELLASYDVDRWRAFDFGLSIYPANQFYAEHNISPVLCKAIGELGMNLVMSNYFIYDTDYMRQRVRKLKRARKHKKVRAFRKSA